jgi:hypothetical protein
LSGTNNTKVVFKIRKLEIVITQKNRGTFPSRYSIFISSFCISIMSHPTHVQERNQDATVYVGDIDQQVTEPLLWELMLQGGPVGNKFDHKMHFY